MVAVHRDVVDLPKGLFGSHQLPLLRKSATLARRPVRLVVVLPAEVVAAAVVAVVILHRMGALSSQQKNR